MSRHLDPNDRFAEDLRSAFPLAPMPQELAEKHAVAMMAEAHLLADQGTTPETAGRSQAADERLQTRRRRSMQKRILRRVIAVAAGLALSLGGVAIAGALTGDDDPGDDDQATLVSTDDTADLEDGDDVAEAPDADDQGEDADDQGEDGDDQGEDADDQGDDDQGEDADDQGEDGDDQGEDGDHQGEDGDDQGDDDQGDDDDQGHSDNQDDDSNSDGDQGENGDN